MKLRAGRAIVLGLALAACAPQEPAERADDAPAGTPAATPYPRPGGAWEVHRSDFAALTRNARRDGIAALPIGERMTAFGRYFIGRPYVAHTLDLAGSERLVVNLKELDCVTLVENALALSRAAAGPGSFEAFLAELEAVRYRGGRLDGYTSRLHYFSDWLADAERKGLVRDITADLGGEPLRGRIHFMTSNHQAYRALRENPALIDSLRVVEDRLTRMELYWIPEERIAAVESRIREGDIIGITTRIDGLDISHAGLATRVNGRVHLLHAPDVGEPVEISARPLAERIRANRRQSGIMVARPLEDGLAGRG